MQEAHNKSICLLLLYIFKVIPTKPWCGSNTATKKKENDTKSNLCVSVYNRYSSIYASL